MNYKVYAKGGGRGNGRYHYHQVISFKQLIENVGLLNAIRVRWFNLTDHYNTYGSIFLGGFYKIEKTNEQLTKPVYL